MRHGTTVCLMVAATAAAVEAQTTDWGTNPIWDDGLAEVAVYEAQRPVYGKIRTYESTMIAVKEDLNLAYHAKADPPYEGKRLLPVIKLNIVSEIETENYPYRYLTSIFVERENAYRLVKMTTGSQEWCGNTFKELKSWGDGPKLIYHSYRYGQGDGSYPLDWRPGTMLEDQLPLSLRGLPFAEGYATAVRTVPTQISNKAPEPRIVESTVRVIGHEEITAPAGTFSCWRVDVKTGKREQTYWFEAVYPNILVRLRSEDGRSLVLKERTRRRYW